MADIISRIVLQAQGGDQVAAEYRKITRAASEAARASQGIGTGGGGAAGGDWSAFNKATQSEAGSNTAFRESRNADYLNRLQQRQQHHGGLQSQNQASSRGMFQLVNQATGAVSQAGQGDIVGGGGQLIQGIASKLGPWGIAIAAAVGAGLATNKLAQKDLELRQQTWNGIGQRLNEQSFETFRPKLRALETAGFTEQTLPFMAALAAAGGKGLGAGESDALLRLQYRTGIDVGTLATLTGRLQQGGVGTGLAAGGGMAWQAETAFGRGGMTMFYQTITSAIEGAMDRGFTKGSAAFVNAYATMAQRLADLSIYGKMTPQGAIATFQAVQKSVAAAAAGPQRPEDVMQFMMMRKPGESYIETIKRMSEPGADLAIYQNLKSSAGNNREALIQMVMTQFGFSDYRMAEGFIGGAEARLGLIAAPRALAGAGGAAAPFTDETLRRRAAQALRSQTLERWGITEGAGGIMRWATELLGGKPSDPVAEENKRIWQDAFKRQNVKGYGAATGAMTTMIQGGGTGFMGMLPAEMQSFARYALTEEGYGATGMPRVGNPIFESVLPLFAMYEQYSKGNTKNMSSAEITMMQKYSPMFKLAKEQFGEFGGQLASYSGMEQLTQAIYDANKENLDRNKDITIVDILRAIELLLETGTWSDTGTTEKP